MRWSCLCLSIATKCNGEDTCCWDGGKVIARCLLWWSCTLLPVQSQRKFEFGIEVYDEVIQICTQDKKGGFVVFFNFNDFPEHYI